ncbi:hypothetical protein HL666_01875 [Bradyrhizobium sp. 83002]|nr:hypothetical protein [Bradyrhizobium aeschynomenes]NPU09509.1 hypothetical protein [Bradyrhizobium aeschynomenes]NPV20832.1 hypothetical protein [Bradyrhizobium aeschynomenes]
MPSVDGAETIAARELIETRASGSGAVFSADADMLIFAAVRKTLRTGAVS